MTDGFDLGERVHRRLLDGAAAVDRSLVQATLRAEAPLVDGRLADRTVDQVLARIEGLGPLAPLLDDPSITEVMVNGDGVVWIERGGSIEAAGDCIDGSVTRLLIERIVTPLGLRVDRSSPMVDARLADGSRVNAVLPPLAVDGPCLTIRRFGAKPLPLAAFASESVQRLLTRAVAARCNIVVSGGSGAGKTTLLNALGAEFDPSERIVTVEDAAELRLPGSHVVRLEARPANVDGVGAVTIRALVRNALRMRPDRLIVGEVRGAEAFDLVQACNTGHDGTLATCHANAPVDALRRLESLALMSDVALPLAAVREQVHSSIDLIVQVSRLPDGSRTVTSVAEVDAEPTDRRVHLLATVDTATAELTRGRRPASPVPRPTLSGRSMIGGDT